MITGRNQAHDFVDVRSGTDAVVDFGAGTQAECSARRRKLRPNSLLRRKGHQHLLSSGTFRFDKDRIRPLDCYNRPVDHITQQGRCSGVTANPHIHQCDIWQNHGVVEKARGIHFRVDRVLIHLLYSPWRLFARTNSRARASQLGHDTGRSRLALQTLERHETGSRRLSRLSRPIARRPRNGPASPCRSIEQRPKQSRLRALARIEEPETGTTCLQETMTA